jgi:hypothetical protein
MTQRKFIISHAFGYDYGGKNKDCGAQDKIQPLLDDGWKIVEMKLTGKTPGDSTVAVYLERETKDNYEPKTCKTSGGCGQYGPPPPPGIDGL